MQIAALILVWNELELTLACLASLQGELPPEQIWVLDNGSQPALANTIRQQVPGVRVVRLEQNIGFAGGCNRGLQLAFGSGATAVLLLNNDATVEAGSVAALARQLQADPQVAVVGPKIYYAGTARVFQTVGMQLDPDSGAARHLGTAQPDRGQFEQPADREGLSGCAWLLRRAAWEQVGPFWEPLFAYAEETDWCLRARRNGWRLRYTPDAVVWHNTSHSLGHDSPLKLYLITRNQLYLRQRHQRGSWRGLRGWLYASYVTLRQTLGFVRRAQWQQAYALGLGWWDYWRGRTGLARSSTLRVRRG
jgi:GT2 family glycosyltransferase